MAQAGDTRGTTPTQRQRIAVRTTAQATGGELLEMEAYYAPGGTYPPEHLIRSRMSTSR